MRLHYLTLFVAICGLTGCSKNATMPDDQPQKQMPVSLSATKSAEGFTAPTSFAPDSEIGVYITSASAGLKSSGNHTNNAKFTATGSGFNSTGTTYPAGVTDLDFYAYTPYSVTGIDGSNEITFSVETDQKNADKSDLLWVKKTGIATATVPALIFDHKLTQIIITLKAAASVMLSSPTVNVAGTLPTVKMNIENGTLGTAEGKAGNIVPTAISEKEMHAIIVPQTVALGTDFILVQNGGKSFKHTLKTTQTFTSGKFYTFEITIKDSSIDVNFTGSVNGWNPGDTISGDAV